MDQLSLQIAHKARNQQWRYIGHTKGAIAISKYPPATEQVSVKSNKP